MQKIRVLELFAGVGACSKALERLGIPCEIVDAVEVDKYAIKSFNAVHGTNFEPQDIKNWDKDIKVDLIMHGSPCQDFSVAGRGAGGDEGSGTRSSLLYETLRIVDKLRPKYVIWENVKNLLSKKHIHNWEAYAKRMEEMGYKNYHKILNAKDYGIPQNRERVFTISVREREREYEWPSPISLERKLKDMLEPEVDEKYYLSNAMMDYFMGVNQKPSKFPRKERFLANINRKDQDRANSITTNPGNRPTDNFVKDEESQPHIFASRGRGDNNEQHLESRKDGLTNTITSVQKDNYVAIKTANKQGYDMATDGDGVDLAYPNSTTRRGRVGHGVAKTLACQDTMGVVEYKTKNQRIIDTAEKSGFRQGETAYLDVYNGTPRTDVTSTINAGTDSHQNNIIAHQYRIRKLTPLECWRLMGFDDADFEKAQKVNSNTQLYKQAGNSIVVNVLEGILKNLLTEEKCKQKSTSQMRLWN